MGKTLRIVEPRACLEAFVTRVGSQAEAARRLDISRPYLYRMYRGLKPISPQILSKLGLRRAVVKS